MSSQMQSAALLSDADVVRALHADRHDSLEHLVVTHRRCLVRYAEGILGENGNSEDVVQEAFFRLWSRRREVSTGGSLRGLLYTLTRNAAIDEQRRCARRNAAALVAGAPACPTNPLDAAATSELGRALATAISRLPTRRRQVFVLARVKGLTHREISQAMGVSPQTVANQMAAALRSLRQVLASYQERSHSFCR